MPDVASSSFTFYTSSNLMELTGQKARHLKEFVEILKIIDGASIFCHTHQAFREFHFAKGIFTNDFAYWAAEAIQEEDLAERLASVDIRDFVDIRSLRERLIEIIEDYLGEKNEIRIAPRGKEFHFCKSISIASRTSHEVWTLSEFRDALKKVGDRSLFYHFFDARLRLERSTNDFSNWIESSLGKPDLAGKIEKLDPYLFTLDGIRERMMELIDEELRSESIDEMLKDRTLGVISKMKAARDILSKIFRKKKEDK